MGESKSVAHFMGRQLSHPVEGHVDRSVVVTPRRRQVVETGLQSLTVQIVLSEPKAAQVDVTFDNFTRSWVLY